MIQCVVDSTTGGIHVSNVDFASVKEKVGIVDALQLLGIDGLKPHNNQLRGQCPLCNGADPRKFVVTPARDLWYSFCCKVGGDQISLVAKVKDIPLRDAAIFLSGEKEPAPKRATAPQEQSERNQPLHALDYLEPEHQAVLAVGINPIVAKRLGIGFAPKGVARGHVLLPIRDEQGLLHGYIGLEEATFLPKDFQPPENVVPFKKEA